MKLKDYLDEHNLTEGAFGDRVGVTASAINRLIPKEGEPAKRKPGFDLMARIAAATGGAVMPNDFMDDLPELIEGFEADGDDEPAFLAPLPAAGSIEDDAAPRAARAGRRG